MNIQKLHDQNVFFFKIAAFLDQTKFSFFWITNILILIFRSHMSHSWNKEWQSIVFHLAPVPRKFDSILCCRIHDKWICHHYMWKGQKFWCCAKLYWWAYFVQLLPNTILCFKISLHHILLYINLDINKYPWSQTMLMITHLKSPSSLSGWKCTKPENLTTYYNLRKMSIEVL